MIKNLHVHSTPTHVYAKLNSVHKLGVANSVCRRLQSLFWMDSNNYNYCRIFFHASITTFHLCLPSHINASVIKVLFDEIAYKMFFLKHLWIVMPSRLDKNSRSFAKLVKG